MASDTPVQTHAQQRLAYEGNAMHGLVYWGMAGLIGSCFLLYVVSVLCIGIFIGWGVVLTMQAAGGDKVIGWDTMVRLGFLTFGSVVWLGMLRPLRRHVSVEAGTQAVSANSQPQIYKIMRCLGQALGGRGDQRVLLDSAPTIRSGPPEEVGAVLRGDTVVRIGLPLVAVLSAREFAACIAMRLARGRPSVGALALRFVLAMDTWFRHSLERDAELNPLKTHPHAADRNLFQFLMGALLWLSQRPFWVLMMIGCGAGRMVQCLDERDSKSIGIQLIGHDGLEYMIFKMRLLRQCFDQCTSADGRDRCESSLTRSVLHRFTTELEKLSPFVARAPSGESPSAAGLIANLPSMAGGAALILHFDDLACQLTPLSAAGRPFSEDDAKKWQGQLNKTETGPTLRQVEALAVIRRYFGGLMHPERALCGLANTAPGDPEALRHRILACRQWEKSHAPKVRVLVREWNLAWRRRRDMEAAWASSLAGFSVCRLEGGGAKGSLELYRKESAAQKAVMEHLESAIRSCEARLELRFTSALGLLWGTEPAILPGRLREMRQSLPLWASVYESLAGVLPEFRELLTDFHTFQSLTERVAGSPFTGDTTRAVQAVVPGLMNRARQILLALDGACYPFAEGGIVITMEDYLCKGEDGLQRGPNLNADVGMHLMAQNMVSDTGISLSPFVARFLELHHRSFAWLAAAAEASELHFIGPAELRDINDSVGESFARLIKPSLRTAEREMALI